MEWISVEDRLPEYKYCDTNFLCRVKECNSFVEYEIAEWSNPIVGATQEDSNGFEKHEQPHFNIKVSSVGQQYLDRRVTHWMPLLEPQNK
jgi:hypothetical protein